MFNQITSKQTWGHVASQHRKTVHTEESGPIPYVDISLIHNLPGHLGGNIIQETPGPKKKSALECTGLR